MYLRGRRHICLPVDWTSVSVNVAVDEERTRFAIIVNVINNCSAFVIVEIKC